MASGDEPFKRETTLEVLVTHWPGYTPVYLQTLLPLAGEAVGVTLAHVGHGNLVAPVLESSAVVADAVWLPCLDMGGQVRGGLVPLLLMFLQLLVQRCYSRDADRSVP